MECPVHFDMMWPKTEDLWKQGSIEGILRSCPSAPQFTFLTFLAARQLVVTLNFAVPGGLGKGQQQGCP